MHYCCRRELLIMVKKHSDLIGKTIVDEQDASDVEMDSKFWHNIFDLYFIRGKESRGRQDDDIIFLVRKMVPPSAPSECPLHAFVLLSILQPCNPHIIGAID